MSETNLKPKYEIKLEDAKLHISKGNSKLGKGIYNFSTLPGNDKHLLYVNEGSELLTNIPGTCSKFCDGCFNGGCYAVRDARLHNNVTIKAWGENTLLLRSRAVFKMIDDFITAKNAKYRETGEEKDLEVKMFRINVSGEVESVSDLLEWDRIAMNHPEVLFGIYTKNFEALEAFLAIGEFADNLCVNVSQWNHVADAFLAKHPDKLNVFEYDETNRKDCDWPEEDKVRLANTVHCPAVNKGGHHVLDANGNPITCDKCGRCYGKRGIGLKTAVYSH